MTVTKRTETALGGFFADPATMTGRSPDGGRLWSYFAAEQMAMQALAREKDPTALRPPSPWDIEGALPFPAIRRLAVKSPAILRTLPEQLGARPGTRYLEGIVDRRQSATSPSPVALDPGYDLAAWKDLAWKDRSGGQPIRVTRCHLQRLTTPTGHLRHLWALSDRVQSFVNVSESVHEQRSPQPTAGC